jgi:hypothetical protein
MDKKGHRPASVTVQKIEVAVSSLGASTLSSSSAPSALSYRHTSPTRSNTVLVSLCVASSSADATQAIFYFRQGFFLLFLAA